MKKENQILSYLEDEQSKFIYQKRVEYNETGNFDAIKAIIDRYLPGIKAHYPGSEKEILERIKDKRKIVVFGSGGNGERVLEYLKTHKISVECFVDNDRKKWGNMIDGIIVRAPSDINYKEVDALIITPYDDMSINAIHEQLAGLGANQNSFIAYKEWFRFTLAKEQYFDPDIIKLRENEVFVDAGVLNLGTSLRFMQECKKEQIQKFKIHAFEPDMISYQRCLEIQKKLPNVDLHLHHAGLWSEKTTLYFTETGGGGSRVTQQETGTYIDTVSLDQCVSDKVTFIKMDIEGAELEALKGSREIIRKYKPRLAISIYHKKEDLVEIPSYIKELVPEYKLYVRHYSNVAAETVLYAVCN